MTDPLGKTVEETGDNLITTQSKYNNNKQNMVIFYKICKKYTNSIYKNKMDLNIRKMTNHPPSPKDAVQHQMQQEYHQMQ